jgi:hypothetical protein
MGQKGHGLGCSGSGMGRVMGYFECDNEPPGSIKCCKFLDYLEKDAAP